MDIPVTRLHDRNDLYYHNLYDLTIYSPACQRRLDAVSYSGTFARQCDKICPWCKVEVPATTSRTTTSARNPQLIARQERRLGFSLCNKVDPDHRCQSSFHQNSSPYTAHPGCIVSRLSCTPGFARVGSRVGPGMRRTSRVSQPASDNTAYARWIDQASITSRKDQSEGHQKNGYLKIINHNIQLDRATQNFPSYPQTLPYTFSQMSRTIHSYIHNHIFAPQKFNNHITAS